MNWLLLRALFALLLLPGSIGFAIPLLLIAPDVRFDGAAAVLTLAAGIVILLWCVRNFYVSGRGTLAPWDPPRRLVRTGLYRFSRNPMYVGVLMILTGWAAGFHSWSLAGYGAVVAVAFHLRVLLYEEPTLARRFGDEWDRYKRQVSRWIGVGRATD